MTLHPRDLWDFDDPRGSEKRFTEALLSADSPEEAGVWQTQVARALGLQKKYDEGHAVLDSLDDELLEDSEVRVRATLERGRLLRSAGDSEKARHRFQLAAGHAEGAGLEELQVDALHMLALVAPVEDQVAIAEHALAIARRSTDQRARDWDAALLNNLGMSRADAGDFAGALDLFREALAACERIGELPRIRIARWMVGWALRNLGRRDEALVVQRELKADLESTGDEDPYVDEELALLAEDAPAGS